MLARSTRICCSLIDADGGSRDASTATRAQRLARVAKLYNLDPKEDDAEIVARAASSLPEEENGTWADVAVCTARNVAVVGALLAAVGAFPGQASAVSLPAASLPAASLIADAETLDVIASIAVPLLVGGALTAFLAVNYKKLIDNLQGK